MDILQTKIAGITGIGSLKVDFESLPDGLIAVVGVNGAGKTTLLECMAPAPLWLSMPSRGGALRDYATGRDALIDTSFQLSGSVWRSLVCVDTEYSAGRGKTEATLYRDGVPLNDGKVRTYREAVTEHLPSRSVFMASVFAASDGVGDFSRLTPASRKDLFGLLLGIRPLHVLSERARAVSRVAADAVTALRRASDKAEEALRRHAALEIEQREAERRLSVAESEAEEAERERQGAEERLRSATSQHERQTTAQRQIGELSAERSLHVGYIQNEARIRRDSARRVELSETTGRLRGDLDAAVRERDRDTDRLTLLRMSRRRASEEVDRLIEAERSAQSMRDRIAELGSSPDRFERLRSLRTVREKLQAELSVDERATRETLQRWETLETQVAARERASELLDSVPCQARTLGGVDCGSCRFISEATDAVAGLERARSELEEADEEFRALSAGLSASREGLAAIDQEIGPLSTAPGELDELKRLQAIDLAPSSMVERATEAAAALDEEIGTLTQQKEQSDEAAEALRASLESMTGEFESLAPVEAAVIQLGIAEERVPIIDSQIAKLCQVGLPDDSALDFARRKVAKARQREATARQELQHASRTLGQVIGQLEELGDVEASQHRATEALETAVRKHRAYDLLSRSLGRNGVQALLIDAAGPAVSELATRLLEGMVGPRWTIALRTRQEAGSGRKAKEVFDLQVQDGAAAPRSYNSLSKGERVLVDEALKLAIAIYRTDTERGALRTLWRDENDGNLHESIRHKYPAMLREGLKLGGFRRCFFVTHDMDVARQADRVIRVAGGGVTFCHPEEV